VSECKYRTRENGTLFVPNIHPEKVEALYQIKKERSHLVAKESMESLISSIEEELFKNNGYSFKEWLDANRASLESQIEEVCSDNPDNDDALERSLKKDIRQHFKVILE